MTREPSRDTITPQQPPLAIRAWLRWDVVASHVDTLRPNTILEIGCGRGAMGARLASRSTYTGLEPDPTSFKAARSNVEPHGGQVRNETTDALPPGSTFDMVCAYEVLEHLQDDAAALTEWAGLVRPGGHLMISVPAFQHRFGPMDTHAGHFRRYEPQDLEVLVRAAGLEPVATTVYAWPAGYALEAVRNRIDARRLRTTPDLSKAELTSASGRAWQPQKRLTGLAIQAGTLPFRRLQRRQPTRGTGIVLLARRPHNAN